jgi:lysozyme family protein
MYLTNSLPYAMTIEYGGYPNPPKNPTGKTIGGFSTQAPAGVVRVTAEEMVAQLSQKFPNLRFTENTGTPE